MRKLLGCVCLLQLLFVGILRGQGNRATITGTVTDASGGPVVGVDVTAKNLGTNELTSAVTNEDGIYSIPNLFPGTYSLELKKAGFKPVEYPSLTLESTQIAQMNVSLQVGAVTDSVVVTADAPVLDKENATIGTNLRGDVITDLPLNAGGGRDIEQFALALTPGYSPLSSTYQAVINGTQIFTKEFTVDGTSGTATIQGDSVEIGPPMEAIQEVEAQTSGLAAQNGVTNGGVVMFNLKSGTNQFHGSAFGYGHNELLDARTWGNRQKAKARFWDYGFSAGGPIIKNKTFFFGTLEHYTEHDITLGQLGQNTGAASVPTPAMLGGDFSALLQTTQPPLGTDTHGLPIYPGAIFNPKDPGAVFPGNKITIPFSTVAQKIVPIYQKSYIPEGSGLVGNERIPNQGTPVQTPYQAVIRIDHNLSQQDRLYGSWIYGHRHRINDDCGGVWATGSLDGGTLACARFQLTRSHEWRVSEAHTFAPTLLNVFNATYNWYWNGSVPTQSGTNWAQQLGFGNTGASNFPSINFGPSVNGFNTTSIGNTWQGYYVGATLIVGDSLTWTKGRHAFTFGGDWRAMEINSHGGSGAFSFSFNNNATGAPTQSYANQVGFGFASFLLGDAQSASQTTPFDLYGRRKAMDLYAQDNWKITPKLTLNLGLRWDATFRFHEKYGHWANFDLTAIDPALGIRGSNVYATGGGDSFEKNEYWKNFAPQIGLAYSPWQRWVFRGSFGILYVPIGIQYYEGVPYGYAPGFRGTNAAAAPFNWDSGYPGVFTPGQKVTTPPLTQFPVVTVDPRALRAGYTNNINVGVQYQLTPSMRAEVSYIGNRGHRLQDSALANNQSNAATFLKLAQSGNGFNYVCSQADATANGVPFPFTGFCAPAFAAIAPYPQLAASEANYWFYPNLYYVGLPLGQSYYNSMVVQVVKRFERGLSMNFSYTLSKQESNTFNNFGDSYDVAGIQDFANLSEAAHTLSPYDTKHVVKGAIAYDLPLGNGHRLLADKGRVVNAIVSGWRVSSLLRYASGKPLTFYSTNYYWYPLWAATYVNYNVSGYQGRLFDPGKFDNSGVPSTSNQYFPTTVATNPAYANFGSGPARIDALRGFGQDSEDVSILKYFSFGPEAKYHLQFRVEFYNIFNRHGFAEPDTNLNSKTFGQVTGVSSSPRHGQFGARFTF